MREFEMCQETIGKLDEMRAALRLCVEQVVLLKRMHESRLMVGSSMLDVAAADKALAAIGAVLKP